MTQADSIRFSTQKSSEIRPLRFIITIAVTNEKINLSALDDTGGIAWNHPVFSFDQFSPGGKRIHWI